MTVVPQVLQLVGGGVLYLPGRAPADAAICPSGHCVRRKHRQRQLDALTSRGGLCRKAKRDVPRIGRVLDFTVVS